MVTMHRTLFCRLSGAALFGAFAWALSTPVLAEGWYIGAGFGETTLDPNVNDICPSFGDLTCNIDDSDSGLKIYGGFDFNRNIGIEFGFADLGELSMSGLDSVFGATQTSTEAATVFAAARGIVPIGDDFAVFGKAGLHAWVADWTLNSSLVPLRDDANGVSFLFGLGASVSVGRMVEIRGEWERFADIGDVAHTDEFDADLLSVGVLLKF